MTYILLLLVNNVSTLLLWVNLNKYIAVMGIKLCIPYIGKRNKVLMKYKYVAIMGQ